MRKFGWDLVKGLRHVHELGIIFSDLTPSKVWICIHVYLELSVLEQHIFSNSPNFASRSYWMAVAS